MKRAMTDFKLDFFEDLNLQSEFLASLTGFINAQHCDIDNYQRHRGITAKQIVHHGLIHKDHKDSFEYTKFQISDSS